MLCRLPTAVKKVSFQLTEDGEGKKGGGGGWKGEDRLQIEGVCLDLRVILDSGCVLALLPALKENNYSKQELEDMAETKRHEGKREDGEWGGGWHRWRWLLGYRMSFHPHYTCPLQPSQPESGPLMSRTNPHWRRRGPAQLQHHGHVSRQPSG